MLNALILAGNKEKGPLEIATNVENKALIIIDKKPIIEYVVDALNKTDKIDRVVVIGPVKELYPYIGKKVEKILEPGDSILENMEMGLKYYNSENNLLILTSDIPLITPQAIEEFVKINIERGALIGYPIITKSKIIEKYPSTVRTYFKMKEGIFCGGNIVFFKPEIFFKQKMLIQELFNIRKSTWKYAKIFGFKFIIKFLLKTLTLEDIENKITKIIGCKSAAIMISYPEIMIDLDKISDFELIKQCLIK